MGLRGGYQEDENALLGTIYFTIKVKHSKNHQKHHFKASELFWRRFIIRFNKFKKQKQEKSYSSKCDNQNS